MVEVLYFTPARMAIINEEEDGKEEEQEKEEEKGQMGSLLTLGGNAKW